MCIAATHADVLAEIAGGIEVASNSEEAMHAPLHLGWRAVTVLSFVRASRERHATLLITAGRTFDTQSSVHQWIQEDVGPACIVEWTRWRLSAMLGGEPAPGEGRLCEARFRILLESFPFCVALAPPRLTGNAWVVPAWLPSSRR